MTPELLERFYVEVTNPDELGLTDSRFEDLFQMARKYAFLLSKIDTPENRLHFCAYMNWHPSELEGGMDAAIARAMKEPTA